MAVVPAATSQVIVPVVATHVVVPAVASQAVILPATSYVLITAAASYFQVGIAKIYCNWSRHSSPPLSPHEYAVGKATTVKVETKVFQGFYQLLFHMLLIFIFLSFFFS